MFDFMPHLPGFPKFCILTLLLTLFHSAKISSIYYTLAQLLWNDDYQDKVVNLLNLQKKRMLLNKQVHGQLLKINPKIGKKFSIKINILNPILQGAGHKVPWLVDYLAWLFGESLIFHIFVCFKIEKVPVK